VLGVSPCSVTRWCTMIVVVANATGEPSVNDASSVEPGRVDLAWAARHPPGAVLDALGSTPAGLPSTSAAERLAGYGPNVLATTKVTAFDVLVRQLRNPATHSAAQRSGRVGRHG
jgi:hypothetical protein